MKVRIEVDDRVSIHPAGSVGGSVIPTLVVIASPASAHRNSETIPAQPLQVAVRAEPADRAMHNTAVKSHFEHSTFICCDFTDPVQFILAIIAGQNFTAFPLKQLSEARPIKAFALHAETF